MTTIGFFGGSFNPPHAVHQLIACYVTQTQAIDELWVAPTYRHAFGKDLASFDDRVAMCEHAMGHLPKVRISRIEAEVVAASGRADSRTLHTLQHAQAADPRRQFRLVIGSDILGETHLWHRWDEVIALAPPLVLARAGVPLPAGASYAGVEMPALSSTEIRARLAAGQGAAGLLPHEVLRYIHAHALYGASPATAKATLESS